MGSKSFLDSVWFDNDIPIHVMNHKWGKTEKDGSGIDYLTCKTCGCQKSYFYGIATYMRSGIVYANRMPECIDEKIENAKTID